MPEVRTRAVRVTIPSQADQFLILNEGDTLYYSDNKEVSASNNEGSLASGQRATLKSPSWLVSASSSVYSLFDIEEIPDYNVWFEGLTLRESSLPSSVVTGSGFSTAGEIAGYDGEEFVPAAAGHWGIGSAGADTGYGSGSHVFRVSRSDGDVNGRITIFDLGSTTEGPFYHWNVNGYGIVGNTEAIPYFAIESERPTEGKKYKGFFRIEMGVDVNHDTTIEANSPEGTGRGRLNVYAEEQVLLRPGTTSTGTEKETAAGYVQIRAKGGLAVYNWAATAEVFRTEPANGTKFTRTEAGAAAFKVVVTGDVQPRLEATAAGVLKFGVGGETVTDVNLYRKAAKVLGTDQSFSVGERLFVTRTEAAAVAFQVFVTGDVQPRLSATAAGVLKFGPGGEVATDVNLFRSATKTLKAEAEKFLLTGALGIANSEAATVGVGAISHKMQIFDASGASLGYIPIYASIT